MAATTTTRRRKVTTPAPEPVNVLDSFRDELVLVEGISAQSDLEAILSKVLFGAVLGAMRDAVDEDLAPVKARILLMLALTKTNDGAEIQRMFTEY